MTKATRIITWRMRLRSTPQQVYDRFATDRGRASFWCTRARSTTAGFELTFPNGLTLHCPVLDDAPPDRFAFGYLDGTRVDVRLEPDGPGGGTLLTLTETGLDDAGERENRPGWVSVLLILKAAADHGVDLRNADPSRTWDQGFIDQ